MKEWSDEELDKLFRKSAEEFEPHFEPDDWKQLRHRLDDADQVEGGGWMEQALPWTIGLLVLMMLGGISVYFGSNTLRDKRDILLMASDTRSPGSLASAEQHPAPKNNIEAGKEGKLSPSEKPKADMPVSKAATPSNEKIAAEPPATTEKHQDKKELPRRLVNVSGVRKQTALNHQERGKGAILLVNDKQQATRPQPPVLSDTERSRALPAGAAPRTSALGIAGESAAKTEVNATSTPSAFADSAASESQLEVLNLVQLSPRPITPATTFRAYPLVDYPHSPDSTYIQERILPKPPKWAIRFGISPDLSFVNMNMKHISRPGPAASLLAEYSLAPRWLVQAGVIRSLKIYSAQAGTYEWPSNWYQKQRPVSVDGSCQVFELPLNLRYDFAQRERGRWFAGTGVSSYKMQKEKYVYNYKTYDPAIRWWKWEGQTGWYLFSHANASIGYERLLTKRLSIMAEPYARIPLRRVGFGKVNLFSTGVWFSLRYAPAFRK